VHRKPTVAVNAVMEYYGKLARSSDPNHQWLRWSAKRKRFSLEQANVFFLNQMLDQLGTAGHAQDAAEHLVRSYFRGRKGFWNEILKTHPNTVARICKTGFAGKSYAAYFAVNKFPRWLRSAAKRMVEKYSGDPRKIWNVSPRNVHRIYERLLEFDGIGENIASMGQFLLVRGYKVAGGKENQSKMSIKLDVLVRRVLARLGIAEDEKQEDEKLSTAKTAVAELDLRSPADFDAALWTVGREYCANTEPDCENCPLNTACASA